jgi:hypothetical protein
MDPHRDTSENCPIGCPEIESQIILILKDSIAISL